MRNFDYRALGRLKAGQMNKTEAAYAQHLEVLRHAGKILWYRFEGIKLRLADNTFLTVDFAILNSDQELEMVDVKGRSGKKYFCLDDSKVKLKVAAEQYPFRFAIAWPIRKGEWMREEL